MLRWLLNLFHRRPMTSIEWDFTIGHWKRLDKPRPMTDDEIEWAALRKKIGRIVVVDASIDEASFCSVGVDPNTKVE